MNIIKNSKRILKSVMSIILISGCCIANLQAQETITSKKLIKSQADIDWEALDYEMQYFGSPLEYEEAKKSFLTMKQYEDKILKKRSQLAKAFWDNYPDDERHFSALYIFFNAYAEPRFIQQEVSDNLTMLLASVPRSSEQIKRLLPRDNLAREQWLKTGDAMVASVLNSNTSLELKESAEFQLISREFRHTLKLSWGLTRIKSESDYWNRFEIQYWRHICLLLESHVNKYGALEVVADRVQNILNLLKKFSTSASDAYWQYFYKNTGKDHSKANQLGIRALYKLAKENVAAIEALKEIDYTKPLDMEFTAMDGSKIDLDNMRGKVVLIDFWATYCAPCIREMPHVRAMYDKYHDQGFEVIGIAADGDGSKKRIEAILKKAGANWPQRLDHGSDASVSFHSLYKITSLPTVWLLNKDGNIVDRDARGERLESLIRKHLDL